MHLRKITEGRIASRGLNPNHENRMQYLSNALFEAFAHVFDDLRISGIRAWSPKPRKLIVVDRRNYTGNQFEDNSPARSISSV